LSTQYREHWMAQPVWQPCFTLPPRSSVTSRMFSPESAEANSNCPAEKFLVG
jgi:hypothetical protein